MSDVAFSSYTDLPLFIFLYQRRAKQRVGEKSENGKGTFIIFFLACVMIVKWHVSSVQFLDARV